MGSLSNYSGSSYYCGSEEEEVPLWIAVTVNVVLIFITVVGNFLVILAYIRDKSIRENVTYKIILNLSITDLLVGIFILPGNTLWWINGIWIYGAVTCKLWLVLDYSLAAISTVAVVFISLDRYWLVTKGTAYQSYQPRQHYPLFMTLSWAAIIGFYLTIAVIVPLMSQRDNFDPENCVLEVYQTEWFNIFEIIACFFVPFSVLVILNIVVFRKVRAHTTGRMFEKYVKSISKNINSNVDTQTQNTVIEQGASKLPEDHTIAKSSMDIIFSKVKNDCSDCVAKPDMLVELTSCNILSGENARYFHDEVHAVQGGNVGTLPAAEHIDLGTDDNYGNRDIIFAIGNDGEIAKPIVSIKSTTPDCMAERNTPGSYAAVVSSMEHTSRVAERAQKSPLRREKAEFKTYRKAAVTLSVLVIMYCICCFPYYIYMIITSFCEDCASKRACEIMTYLQWCNSTINPFIYGLTYPIYRRNILKFLGIERCLKRGN